MRKRHGLLALVLLLAVVLSAPALDFGMTVNNTAGVSLAPAATSSFTERVNLSGFVGHYVTDAFRVSWEGGYQFLLTQPFDGESEVEPYLFDVNHLYVTGSVPVGTDTASVLSYRAGRFRFRDVTGYLLNDRLDGGRVELQSDRGSVSVAAGYSGLVAKENSSIRLSQADSADSVDDDVYFAPPRAVGMWRLSLPNLVGRQGVSLSLLHQEDLRDADTLATGQGLVDTQHLGLRANGPIIRNLYYSAFGFLETGSELSVADGGYAYASKLAYFGGAGLQYLNRDALFSLAELRYLHSSGDPDYRIYFEGNTSGDSELFTGISDPGLGQVFAPRLGNLMVVNAAYSFKPLSQLETRSARLLQLRLDSYVFFRETAGAISAAGLNPDSTDRYLGTEADLSINFRPFSDLGLTLAGGVFVPNTSGSNAAFDSDERGIAYQVRLTSSFSF